MADAVNEEVRIKNLNALTKLKNLIAGTFFVVDGVSGDCTDNNGDPIIANDSTVKMSAEVLLNIVNDITAPFDPDVPCVVGKTYYDENGKLYECVTAHSGAWNPDHFEETSVENIFAKAKDVSALQTKTTNISASIAPEYNGTTGAVLGRLYMHNGVLYQCKENTSGDWDSSKFTVVPLEYLLRILPQSATNKLPFEDGFYTVNGAKVSTKQEHSSYKCCKYYGEVGDTFFIVGAGANFGRLWATFDINDNIIRVADSSTTKNWNDNFTVTLEQGEVGIVYNTFYTSVTDFETVGIRLINLCVGHESQSKRFISVDNRFSEVEKDLNGAIINKVIEFSKSSGNYMSFYYKPNAPAKFYVKNNSSSYSDYKLYWSDSANVKVNVLWKTVQFDELVQLEEYREGYDRLVIYNGVASTEDISVDVFEYNLQSVNYRIDEASKVLKDMIELPETSSVYKFTASIGARLSFYYKPVSVPFKFYLKKNLFEFDSYDIYWADSTGVNSISLWKSNVAFDRVLEFEEYPEGYNQLLFFKAGYTQTYAIDVELIQYNINSFNYKINEVERKIEKPYKDVKIICFGDSITQFTYNGKGYPDYLGEISEATVVKGAIGGTRYSLRGEPTATPASNAQAWRALDISYLVHAWCTNDWSIVDPCVQYLHDNDNRDYAPIITALKNNPISTADVVTIMAGTNDFSSEASLGTSGSTDKETVFGAINSIIQEILTTNPKIKLFMFSPTVRWYDYSGVATSDPDKFSDVIVRGGMTLKEFSAAVVGEIEKSHIPVCDMYNTLGWNKWNFSNYFLDTDGTHPYKGFENIANRFYAFLTALRN